MRDCSLGVIFDDTRKAVLLLQRKDLPVWVLPGGGIDPGESPEEAVIREVYEETGLSVAVSRHAAEYAPINRFTTTAHLFECNIEGGQLYPGDEARQVGYFPLDALPDHFFHYHHEWLNEVLTNSVTVRKPMRRATFRSIILFYLRHPWWGLKYLITRWTKQESGVRNQESE